MPKRASHPAPRNEPQQSRSRATVEAILDGATRVLDRESEAALTTARVAEVAGVSIGTLYQYFGNREALLEALQLREFERATALLNEVLKASALERERELVLAVIEGLLALYRRAPGLHRVLALEGLRGNISARVRDFDLRSVALIRSVLAAGAAEGRIRRSNVDAAAFVVFQSVRASMLAYLLEAPAGLNDGQLVAELSDLVLRYLAQPHEP